MPPEPVRFRRLAVLLLGLAVTAGLLTLAVAVLAPGGWTLWEVLILLALLGTVPWSALSAANALIGFAILMFARDPVAAVLPALRAAQAPSTPTPALPRERGRECLSPPPTCERGQVPSPSPARGGGLGWGSVTAIAICVRNEEMGVVLPALARLLDGLAAVGAGARFTAWILSDTQDAALAAAEAQAVQSCVLSRGDHAVPLHYRRRTDNAGFKAGNVMEFLDHHAGDAVFFLCLDADSQMSADAVLRLVACLEADDKLAILQPLIAGRPARAAFPRLFQFGMRQGMRSWAIGQAWWQGDEGPYWGHNALIRIAPFKQHARLERLPDGSAILSHDQVEATRLTAAGWKVRVLPDDTGSLEGNPPALPEFLVRDLRWAAGNLQYFSLIRLPGLTPMARWQLAQAILLFFGAPLWGVLLTAAALNAATGGGASTPTTALIALLALGWWCHYAPKLMGYAEALLKPALAARYGGRALFARGAVSEILFTTLFEPARLLHQARFIVMLPFGRKTGWSPQNRTDRGVAWSDAARLLWPESLSGMVLTALFATASWCTLLLAAPFLLSLLFAIPFCVLTASPSFSAWLRARRIAATPEEIAAEPRGAAGPRKAVG